MANIRSAQKANRASLRKRVFNQRRKNELKATVKNVSAAIARKEAKEAAALLPKAYQAIDKATKNGVIKKNTAGRMKSSIAKRIRAISA